ncbi:major facilitator superfamily transporter [Botrytis cinerea]
MSGNDSKSSNDSDVPKSQSRNRKRHPAGEEANEETSINASNDGGISYGTVSRTNAYAPIKTGEQVHGKNPSQRRESVIEEENNEDLQIEIPATEPEKEGPVAWGSLPHKRQLAILTCARLSEPLVQTSLRSYIFYQLKSFDPSLPDSTIASQAGIMAGSFALAQLTTAMLWGRFSDRSGRKRVLLIGLSGTAISCLGFGFAQNFWQALIFRMIGGALNGNVGVMRTMISEIVKEKKYQSRAFLILPMCGNIGTIIGPILGGILADPAGSYPSIFGGIKWLEKYPYAPPNLLSALFLASASLAVIFALEETHEMYAHKEDWGINAGRAVKCFFRRLRRGNNSKGEYTAISSTASSPTIGPTPITPKSPSALLPGIVIDYRSVKFSHIMCTSVYNPSQTLKSLPADYTPHPPFKFTGGIGLPPRDVGLAMSILGMIGITMQLFLYPIVNARLGTVRSWRIFLYGFPIAYTLAPFLSLIPSASPPPSQKTGPVIWISLTFVLLIQTISRTFAGPATTILINNCSPHPSVLGTIHGIGQTASSAARTVGPALGGYLYGVGLSHGYVGLVFWVLAGMAGVTCLASTEAEEEARVRNRELGFNV